MQPVRRPDQRAERSFVWGANALQAMCFRRLLSTDSKGADHSLGWGIVTSTGKVYLVGAAPGNPDLITVKGLRLVQSADVILHDRLLPSKLIPEVRPDAQVIDVGKYPGRPHLSQTEITELLIAKALTGRIIVRLKGRDPFVFGRGGEEALACAKAGVPFEIVPGGDMRRIRSQNYQMRDKNVLALGIDSFLPWGDSLL